MEQLCFKAHSPVWPIASLETVSKSGRTTRAKCPMKCRRGLHARERTPPCRCASHLLCRASMPSRSGRPSSSPPSFALSATRAAPRSPPRSTPEHGRRAPPWLSRAYCHQRSYSSTHRPRSKPSPSIVCGPRLSTPLPLGRRSRISIAAAASSPRPPLAHVAR